MKTQSEGLNFYFEIAMYNKSHKYVDVLSCVGIGL